MFTPAWYLGVIMVLRIAAGRPRRDAGGDAVEVYVLPRVHERHPELTVDDVLAAFRSVMVDARREDGTWVCIGLDGNGRDVEMVYKQVGGRVLIYHAFTPPTKKLRNEIERLRRRL